ncbi:MAG: S8/S53 family peptidase [Xanthobacteraceae bacterium]|nr:S8/S53 family peptidase [Xanthobacteraceae bacterium]
MIRILSEKGKVPVPCTVTEVNGENTGFTPITEPANCAGTYTLQDPQNTRCLSVEPHDGHWGMFVDLASPDDEITCISMGDPDLPWWQVAVGARSPAAHSARGIRIGIIDVLFRPGPHFERFELVEPDRLKKFSFVSADGHGRQVSAIVRGRGPGKYQGLARDAEVFFVDASVANDVGAASDTKLDRARVIDGIRNLWESYDVDIINLSCGFGAHDFPDLEEAVEEAADNGAVCICAAGNSITLPIEAPARYNAAVAVCGVGFTGVADFPTFLGRLVVKAERDKSPTGCAVRTWRQGVPFLHSGTAWGPQLRAFAPSLGINLRSENGRIREYYGTSYASPIVGSVLACALSGDQIYRELSGRERYDHALRRLEEISVGLDLASGGSSAGMPLLQR